MQIVYCYLLCVKKNRYAFRCLGKPLHWNRLQGVTQGGCELESLLALTFPAIDFQPGPRLVRFAQGLQVNAELLAFLVEMAAFQAERPRHVGHVEIMSADFRKQHFPFKRFGALG